MYKDIDCSIRDKVPNGVIVIEWYPTSNNIEVVSVPIYVCIDCLEYPDIVMYHEDL